MGAPYGESRGDLFHEKRKEILPKGDREDRMSDDLTNAAQVLAIFSVLITTVTFASAFTLPGGYRSAGDGGGAAGTAVLAGSYAFDAFVLSNGLAFLCSFFATTNLLYAGVAYGTLENRFRLINGAYGLMWCSGRSLVTAFALGLYVVLPPAARKIAIAICVLMILLAVGILKESEGIKSFQLIRPYGRRRTCWSARYLVLNYVVPFFDHFWSFIIIFGLPAIRKWKT